METEIFLRVDADQAGTKQEAVLHALADEIIDDYNCGLYVLTSSMKAL